MKPHPTLLAVYLAIGMATPVHAHRMEGLLQASLVEVRASEIRVEVTLSPGMDAARAVTRLIDTNGDGSHSKDETNEWSRLFVAEQNVTVNGQPLSLKLDAMRTNLPAEMSDGHATIAVNFTAIPSEPWHGAQTIVCTNHYQPIHSVYQSNGLIPKDPSVHILSHRRDAAQQALTLNAEFLDSFPETVSNKSKQPRPADPSSWLLGTGLTGAVLAALYRHRSKPA